MKEKWEYHLEPIDEERSIKDWADRFAKLGKAGWELSGAVPTTEGQALVFRRLKKS